MGSLRVLHSATWILIVIILLVFTELVQSEEVEQRSLVTFPPFPSPLHKDHKFDVTLVSQTSMDRFWMLPFLCVRWGGPISVAVLQDHLPDIPEGLCSRMLITAASMKSPYDLDPSHYPVNRLRNVAITAVNTSHFLMTDIDIWPDVNAYMSLHMRYHLEKERLDDPRTAIVFTAFSRKRFCPKSTCLQYAKQTPQTVRELGPCVDSKTCDPFDSKNPDGQGTAYQYYWQSMQRHPEERGLEHIVCFESPRFEPYVMVRKSSVLPEFNEQFFGYGKNKIQWISHLRYSGFLFYLMPVNFVIHAAHPVSLAKVAWKNADQQMNLRLQMDDTYRRFKKELLQQLGEDNIQTQICLEKPRH